ncbi:MAG TPA: M28 family peptidase, partial [Thermoleophilaceae bacterium]|nr:M28 family peptidase [Thermoleophilaceae bacterium]
AGARGVLFGLPLDRRQGRSTWMRPPHNVEITIPALQLGSDEAAQLKGELARGPVNATVSLSAYGVQSTRSLIATIRGRSKERVVVTSHTDGLNSIWDNGPIAMLALARAYSQLPMRCRPRTLELGFVAAHESMRLGSQLYAKRLRSEGNLALVIALEHLGAREWVYEPRADGPGGVLRPTGQAEATSVFRPKDSGRALRWIERGLRRNRLERTFVFTNPTTSIGEWKSYTDQGLPALAMIAGPWSMSLPSFTLRQAVDIGLLRRQSLVAAGILRRALRAPAFPIGPPLPERED